MAAGLRDLQRRIVAVKSIKGVTTAMQNISQARLESAMRTMNHVREYSGDLEKILSSVAVPAEETKSIRHYVFGSDQGLCGSVNTQLIRAVRSEFKEGIENGITPRFVVSGEKLRQPLGKDPHVMPNLDLCVTNVQKTLGFSQISQLCDDLFTNIADEPVDEQAFWFQKMISNVKFEVTKHTIPSIAQIQGYYGASVEVESEENFDVYQNLSEFLTFTSLYRCQVEQEASEHSSRATAMQNASKAAGDMIDVLELKYRKVRQAKITTEIIEISTGAAAVMTDD